MRTRSSEDFEARFLQYFLCTSSSVGKTVARNLQTYRLFFFFLSCVEGQMLLRGMDKREEEEEANQGRLIGK